MVGHDVDIEQLAGVVERQQVIDGVSDELFLVVGRHEDCERRRRTAARGDVGGGVAASPRRKRSPRCERENGEIGAGHAIATTGAAATVDAAAARRNGSRSSGRLHSGIMSDQESVAAGRHAHHTRRRPGSRCKRLGSLRALSWNDLVWSGFRTGGDLAVQRAHGRGGARRAYAFATKDPNIGVARVPDERLDRLTKMSKSKNVVHAAVQVVDIGGLVEGASKGEGLGNKFLANIREVDAIVLVLRAFEDDDVAGRPTRSNTSAWSSSSSPLPTSRPSRAPRRPSATRGSTALGDELDALRAANAALSDGRPLPRSRG